MTDRRTFLLAGGALLAAPGILRAQTIDPWVRATPQVRRNMSSFRAQRWEEHFSARGVVSILADTSSRALHYWSADLSDYRLYPTSVPMTACSISRPAAG